jgi:hypothetical protein
LKQRSKLLFKKYGNSGMNPSKLPNGALPPKTGMHPIQKMICG